MRSLPIRSTNMRRWPVLKTSEIKQVEWFDDRYYKVNVSETDVPVYEYFSSATTKLNVVAKPWLARWKGDVGNREADLRMFEAGERGTRIHHAWYTLTTGGVVIFNPWQRPNYNQKEIEEMTDKAMGNLAVMQYQDEMWDVLKLKNWVDAVKPKIVGSELTVCSKICKDAGTLDNLMEIEEGDYEVNGAKAIHIPKGLYVVDLKTGSLDEDAFMQLACYANCVNEMKLSEQLVSGTIILHTGSAVKKGIEGLSTVYHDQSELDKDFQDFRHAAALWERKNANAKPKIFEFPSLLVLGGNK